MFPIFNVRCELLMSRLLSCIAFAASTMVASCGGGEEQIDFQPFWLNSGMVLADLDGDGRIDVAVATQFRGGPLPWPTFVDVYLQSAPGAFQAPAKYAIGDNSPWALSTGDFDGDGRADLVVAVPQTQPTGINTVAQSGAISVLRQDPTNPGRFLAALQVATGGAAEAAAIAELTGDALADVVVADGVLVNGRALLLAQDPAQPGTLLPPATLSIGAGGGATDVAVGDMNGDGLIDVVLAVSSNVAAVFYQKAGGGFDPVVLLPVGIAPRGVVVADLDGDGRLDIATANAGNAPAGGLGGTSVTLLLQTVVGSFARTDIAVADGARQLAISDLNGDGIPDIAVISLVYQAQRPSRVTVLLQSPATRGQFSVGGSYDGTFIASFIAAGDVNGDGRNDIILNEGPSVLLQQATAPGTFGPVQPLR